MTALQLVNKVAVEKLGLSDAITALANPDETVAKILWALNETQRGLSDLYDYNKLKAQGEITLVTDTTSYALADDFIRFLKGDDALYYTKVSTGATEIAKVSVENDEKFKNHIPSDVTEGKPYIARLFGANNSGYSLLEVYGTPTTTYNGTKLYYEYIKTPADLAADDDVSVFSDHLLIQGASLLLMIDQGDASQADFVNFLGSQSLSIDNDDSGRKKKAKYKDI